ncbi:MAG: hypothetical protein ACI831_000398, partial [Candidatus Azotimanducaceae bacterium]
TAQILTVEENQRLQRIANRIATCWSRTLSYYQQTNWPG